MRVPDSIVCVDCGGRCHLLSRAPEFGWQPGDVAVYRCEDCLDRWDVVVDEDETDDDWTADGGMASG